MKQKKPQYKFEAVYTGRRVLHNEKVVQRFERTDTKEEMLFKGISRVSIGSTYKCAARGISRRPEWCDDRETIHNPEWEGQDALARAFLRREAARRRMDRASKPHVEKALEALIPLCKGASYMDYHRIVGFLVDEVSNRLMKARKK